MVLFSSNPQFKGPPILNRKCGFQYTYKFGLKCLDFKIYFSTLNISGCEEHSQNIHVWSGACRLDILDEAKDVTAQCEGDPKFNEALDAIFKALIG